ncbi:MAG: DNA-processing protein DprA [Lachnospiraceae bacterium]|nr:DNA-processing protein DprA [Lachnospiraceae bacterium]
MNTNKYEHEFWLHCLPNISNLVKFKLHSIFPDLEELRKEKEKSLQCLKFLSETHIRRILHGQSDKDISKLYQSLAKKSIQHFPWNSPNYPSQLMNIFDPPFGLFVKGDLPVFQQYRVAIIGARKCTPYGERNALHFAQELGQSGLQVISGMAYGIDGFGHRGAIQGGGRTFAVLGCGVDVCYPREHIGLYQDILNHGGGIISEYPPGTSPLAYHFPARNRLISALSDFLIIIEAKKRSGSLITADLALEQGKDVYALPGPVDSTFSQGCHQLIKQGAGILLSPEILLEDFGMMTNKTKGGKKKILDSSENLVYSLLCLQPKRFDDLLIETKMEIGILMGVLISLELKGYVKEVSKHNYVKYL